MTKLSVANACVALGLAMVSAPVAGATPPEGDVVRTDIARGDTTAPVDIDTGGAPSTLIVQGLKLAPGASSGWHTHPGPEYSAINSGGVVLQTAGNCAGTEFDSGQAVFIPAGVPHRVANEAEGAAEVVVTYTVPADVPLRVDAPDACAG